MASKVNKLSSSRKRLARIRCAKETIKCFQENKSFPRAFCYIPFKSLYKTNKKIKFDVFSAPNIESEKIDEVSCNALYIVAVSEDSICDKVGKWAKVIEVYDYDGNVIKSFHRDAWTVLFASQPAHPEPFTHVDTHVVPENDKTSNDKIFSGCTPYNVNTWEEIMEYNYALRLESKYVKLVAADEKAVSLLSDVPSGWTLDHDEHLAQFLTSFTECSNDSLGSIKNYVESIEVSSQTEEEGPDCLTDGDPESFWESDGHQGQHWVRLRMKKGTIIKKLIVMLDHNDDNYTPSRIIVMGGVLDNLGKLSETPVDMSAFGPLDITILEEQKEHYPVIEIRIKECRDGIDTRLHGIKMLSLRERELGLNYDLFTKESLVRYPKLENIDTIVLYRRATLLQRFVILIDSILPYLVPSWDNTSESLSSLDVVRQLLPLSKKRGSLIDTFLRKSETGRPSRMPKLYINRRAAAEHKSDPKLEPDCKNTVFNQVYEGLKPRDHYDRPPDYRWSSRFDQWWECKFLAEGIIDQGGGFRDSIADIAEELCPSQSDVPMPLPLFVRSPNLKSNDSNINRDVYIPNSAFKEFHKYEWLGKLMGACLRGKESLVLSLPSFIWKKLVGERVSWSRDFITVDEAEVRMLEHMEEMDEEAFYAYFSEDKTWSASLSNEDSVSLKPGGADMTVHYDDRLEYIGLVKEARMNECDEQVAAIQKGLLAVIPKAVLDLLTWQELEKRICGDPEISVDALRRTTHYEDLEQDDTRVKYYWQSMINFSNEDRSRFLRFVTGRRRLPAPIYLCPDKGDCNDILPESSTCSNTLYLPSYSSAKVCEEKLRYAAYNCIAIDTDMNPWEE